MSNVFAALSEEEHDELTWFSNMKLGDALTEGMVDRSEYLAGLLVINSNIDEIQFCEQVSWGVGGELHRRKQLAASAGSGDIN